MKIAMISSGNSIHVKKIANALIGMGHDITLFTLPNHTQLLSDFDPRIKVILLPIKGKAGYYFNAPYIRRVLKSDPVEIVNSHYASGYGTLARLVGVHPLSLAVFGSDVYEYPFRSRSTMRNLICNLDCADLITSTSYAMTDRLASLYKGDTPVYTTPFGVDRRIFRPKSVHKMPGFEIGIIKKLESIYGYDSLFEALSLLKTEYGVKDARLVIYGRGSAETAFRQRVRQLGLEDCVFFKGFIANENIPDALSHMDVACFPTIVEESFGVAVIEAMACGVPVVASDTPGFSEVLENGRDGLLFPKGDSRALAKALYQVWSMCPKEKENLRQRGLDRVREQYDFEENMKLYESILMQVISKK